MTNYNPFSGMNNLENNFGNMLIESNTDMNAMETSFDNMHLDPTTDMDAMETSFDSMHLDSTTKGDMSNETEVSYDPQHDLKQFLQNIVADFKKETGTDLIIDLELCHLINSITIKVPNSWFRQTNNTHHLLDCPPSIWKLLSVDVDLCFEWYEDKDGSNPLVTDGPIFDMILAILTIQPGDIAGFEGVKPREISFYFGNIHRIFFDDRGSIVDSFVSKDDWNVTYLQNLSMGHNQNVAIIATNRKARSSNSPFYYLVPAD